MKRRRNTDSFLEAFCKHYGIRVEKTTRHLWTETASCLQEAFSILTQSLSSVPASGDIGFYLRIAENSVGRLYDTSSSLVACMACGATGGVESLARVVIEGAWTTRYILEGDYKKRMFAYLFQYTREHPRKLAEWKAIVEESRPGDSLTLDAIDGRMSYITGLHDFIEAIRDSIGQPDIDELLKHWSKSLFNRCDSLGEKEKYYTRYHRLSADSHHNAEQTLQYLHGYFAEAEHGMKGFLAKIGVETIHYSGMMAALAVDEAIVAAMSACEKFGAAFDRSVLDRVRKRLEAHAATLMLNAGAP
jgi:hypothetical protein